MDIGSKRRRCGGWEVKIGDLAGGGGGAVWEQRRAGLVDGRRGGVEARQRGAGGRALGKLDGGPAGMELGGFVASDAVAHRRFIRSKT